MKNVPMYGPEEVHELLDYDGCIAAVRDAMKNLTADGTSQPLRTIVTLASDKLFAVMPGALPEPGAFGAKVISVFGDEARPGRSTHQGVVVTFARDTGRLKCMADAHEITKIRTAAASAVATDVLARRDACRLAVLGCGEQARAHVRAIARVRKLEVVLVSSRSQRTAEGFAEQMHAETALRVRAIGDAREAVEAADIICTVTTSSTPVLFGKWVRSGTHVNVVGSAHAGPVEVDSDLVVASRYVADSRRSALAAAAEFLDAKAAGLVEDDHIVAEIGEVLLGRKPGRTSGNEITLYKSLGHIVQDIAAADYVHARAQRRGKQTGSI